MFFDGWLGPLRVLVVGLLMYPALVAFLRVSGKRTLSKMNAFDFVVTVALGSAFATIVLSKDVVLAEALVALMLFPALQFAVSWLSVRSGTVRRLVKSEPALLLYRGRFLENNLRDQRVTEAEVRAAVRAAGIGSLEEVEAVVLETAGDLSVIARGLGATTVLADVRDAPAR